MRLPFTTPPSRSPTSTSTAHCRFVKPCRVVCLCVAVLALVALTGTGRVAGSCGVCALGAGRGLCPGFREAALSQSRAEGVLVETSMAPACWGVWGREGRVCRLPCRHCRRVLLRLPPPPGGRRAALSPVLHTVRGVGQHLVHLPGEAGLQSCAATAGRPKLAPATVVHLSAISCAVLAWACPSFPPHPFASPCTPRCQPLPL
jgi:hypothetical protein